jgi:hypothetical protein
MFSFKLPQNRHPERSASEIYRVNSTWGAESKDLGGAYLSHAARSFSTTEARPIWSFPEAENQGLASVPVTIECVLQPILLPSFGG